MNPMLQRIRALAPHSHHDVEANAKLIEALIQAVGK